MHDWKIFEDEGDSLEHHGIKGQAWGVRNGPPYPLGSVGKAAFSKVKKLLSNEVRSNRNKQISAKNFNTKMLKAKSVNNDADADYIRSKARKTEAQNEYNNARHRGKMDREQEKLDLERSKTERAKLQGERLKEYQDTIKNLNPNIKGPTQALKDRIINSGDKKLLKKYGYLLNNEEYAQAITRLTLKKDLAKSKFNENHEKFNDTLKNVSNTAGTAVDLYNMTAGTYNSILGDETHQMRQISKEIKKPKSNEEKFREESYKAKNTRLSELEPKIRNGTATRAEREERDSLLGISSPRERSAVDTYNERSAKAKNDLIDEILKKANYDRDPNFTGPPRPNQDTMSNLSDEERAALFSILGIKNWKSGSSGGSSS